MTVRKCQNGKEFVREKGMSITEVKHSASRAAWKKNTSQMASVICSICRPVWKKKTSCLKHRPYHENGNSAA